MKSEFDSKKFNDDGIIFPLTLFERHDSARLITRYYDFQKRICDSRGRELFIKPHLVSTWLDEIVHSESIVSAVESAIGPDIALWSSDFFVKAAGKGTWVSWHQDLPYWNLFSDKVVSAWLALTPSNKNNGCMQVVPGTHKSGGLGKIHGDADDVLEMMSSGVKTSREGNLLTVEQNLQVEVDEENSVDVGLEPGQWSLHHGNIVHGGLPNNSSEDRIGFVMRYVSTDTFCHSGKDSVLLIKGEPKHEEFAWEKRPSNDFDPESLEELDRALKYPSGFGDKALK